MDSDRSKNTIQEQLIDKIRAVLYYEANKKYTEMDDDLIAECADYLMELENRKPLTEKEIDKALTHIFEKSKPSTRKKRILKKLLLAAIISALIFVAAISATYGLDNVLDYFMQWGRTIFSMDAGESIESGNKTIIKNGNYSVIYDTVDELFENENLKILYPSALPVGKEIVHVSYFHDSRGFGVSYSMNNSIYTIQVDNFSNINQYIDTETCTNEFINSYNCYYLHITNDVANYIQCAFEHNGYIYLIGTSTYEEMKFIIENLKEYQP